MICFIICIPFSRALTITAKYFLAWVEQRVSVRVTAQKLPKGGLQRAGKSVSWKQVAGKPAIWCSRPAWKSREANGESTWQSWGSASCWLSGFEQTVSLSSFPLSSFLVSVLRKMHQSIHDTWLLQCLACRACSTHVNYEGFNTSFKQLLKLFSIQGDPVKMSIRSRCSAAQKGKIPAETHPDAQLPCSLSIQNFFKHLIYLFAMLTVYYLSLPTRL